MKIASVLPLVLTLVGQKEASAQSFGPPPDCFTDLDDLLERELDVTDLSVPRTLIICPDTDYIMGRADNDNPGKYVGGYRPFLPRPNAHYKCGESGSSANNCRIIGGEFPILSFGGDLEHTNITFQGLIIESAFRGGMLLAQPGDLTFTDCIIRNHENLGAVLLLFDNPFVRRLAREGWTGDDHTDLLEFTKLIESGNIEDFFKKIHDEESDRDLQEGVLSTLTVTFRQTVFEGNKATPPAIYVRPGIVTAQTYESILVFEDVIFRNNDFGDTNKQSSSWAINTVGPLTIKNTCFEDNAFLRQAPVITFGFPPLDVSNNYGEFDEDLACQFIAEFQDESALEALVNYTCVEYDADSCQAKPPPSPPPMPTSAPARPTRTPISRPTLAPEPTTNPTANPSAASSASSFFWAVSVAFVGVTMF